MKVKELKANELLWECPSPWVPSKPNKTTDLFAERFFGQKRALGAIQMGLNVHSPGYNIFICGIGGTDKAEVVQELLQNIATNPKDLFDHAFVHNFDEPMNPKSLQLPYGAGEHLASGMRNWVHALRTEVPKLLKSKNHLQRKHHLIARYQKAESQLFRRFEAKLQKAQLALVAIDEENGTRRDIHFIISKKVHSPEQALSLPREERPSATKLKKLFARREDFLPQVEQIRNKARAMALRLIRETNAIDEEVVREAVQGLTIALAEELEADEALASWLGDCARHAIYHSKIWLPSKSNENHTETSQERGLEVFEVNLGRSLRNDNIPIVFEPHPNYSNLFGTIERATSQQGIGFVHHAVRPGSLLRADGGILVLNARDVFREAEVWRSLKRTLQSGKLSIHALESLSPLGITGARPEAIPIQVKVVLVGDSNLYDALHEEESDFPKIFKVKAEFEDSLPLNKKHVSSLAKSLHGISYTEKLLPISKTGMCALIERAVSDSGTQKRISTRLPILADYLREASFYAKNSGHNSIQKADVEAAKKHYQDQHAIDAEWYERQIKDGVYELKTSGKEVGVINALTVVSMGPVSFGRPARISALAVPGDESYSNLDSEVSLTGNIHNKGMLTLENFMRYQFGQDKALPARMSISFDQNYGPIDGDSASTTELYALLSALSNIPIRQELAVTGALGMKGEILAVGGVNEKIEGFFRICLKRGLTGTQGVIIPKINTTDLMLSQEIKTAVQSKKFHIYAAKDIKSAATLLFNTSWNDITLAVKKRLKDFDSEEKKKG